MTRLPSEFKDQYESRGETFFEIAEILCRNHGQIFTAESIESNVDVRERQVQNLLKDLSEDEWVESQTGVKTYEWNIERYNPAEIVALNAVWSLYRDLWRMFKRHSKTTTGIIAIFGFLFFVAGFVSASISIILGSGIFEEPEISPRIYLILGIAFFGAGVMITAFVGLQAFVNRFIDFIFDRLASLLGD